MGLIHKDIGEQLEGLKTLLKDKLGIDPAEVDAKYKKSMEELSNIEDEEVRKNRAFTQTKQRYRTQLRSPAKAFRGVVFGAREPYNMIKGMRDEAIVAWNQDKETAIEQGLCNDEGMPLDTRAQFGTGRSNDAFGTPLPDTAYIQNVVGIVIEEDGAIVPFQMTLGDNLANKVEVPTFIPVGFRANPARNQPDASVLVLNPYSRLEFAELTSEEMDGFPDLETILSAPAMEKHMISLDQLESFFEEYEGNRQMFCIAITDVAFIASEPNATTGNIMMVVEDDTIPVDQPGTTVWIPEHLQKKAKFGAGSKLALAGNVVHSVYQEKDNYMLNALGLYAFPEYIVDADENPSNAVSRVD